MTSPSSPSVVHVAWGGGVGGIERLVHDLVKQQAGMGIEVAAAFGQAHGVFADRIRDLGVPVLDLELRSGFDLRRRTLSSAAEKLGRARVLHAHAFNPPLGTIMRRAGRPVLFTHHGNFAQGRRSGMRGAVSRRMEGRFLINRCAAVVANSNWTRERMREVYGIRSDAVTVLHNGIDVDAAPGPVERRRNGRLEVAFVGRLVRFKRVDRIIRALAMLLPRRDVHVIVAGGGPVEDELRTLAEQLGVASQVEFLGWQSEVGAVLSEADVLVLPSENEPFGLVMLEASVLGLLTVAFADGGGALEIVAPDGRVVHSIRELADFLGGLEGSEALSMPARQERSSWTRREFSISETAKRYVDIYKTIDAAPR